MSYVLVVTNNSPVTLTPELHPGQIPGNGGKWTSPVIGNELIKTTIAGDFSVQDIADAHIGGDTGQTWGVLIRYGGEAMVARYEGGGQLTATFDQYLQVKLGGNMAIRQIQLDWLRF